MAVKLVQEEKALLPMLVTLLGMSTLTKLAQPENVLSPMFVTLLGMASEVKLAHR